MTKKFENIIIKHPHSKTCGAHGVPEEYYIPSFIDLSGSGKEPLFWGNYRGNKSEDVNNHWWLRMICNYSRGCNFEAVIHTSLFDKMIKEKWGIKMER